RELANAVGIPVDRLLHQLDEAGLAPREADAVLSDEDKAALLAHLRKEHSKSAREEVPGPKKITLKRKEVSQIKLPAGSAGSRGPRPTRTVNVEVRKRRTYVKRSVVEAEESRREAELLAQRLAEEAERAAAEAAARAREEEEARRRAEEEARKRAEEEEAARKTAQRELAEVGADAAEDVAQDQGRPEAERAPEVEAEAAAETDSDSDVEESPEE